MYLFRNDPSFPRSMYYDYISTYGLTLNPGSYIELETSLYNSYIRDNGSIYDYDFLMSKSLDELDEMCREIRKKYNVNCSKIVFRKLEQAKKTGAKVKEDPLVKLSVYKEKRNKNYLLSQIEQSLIYRKHNLQLGELTFEAQAMRKSL